MSSEGADSTTTQDAAPIGGSTYIVQSATASANVKETPDDDDNSERVVPVLECADGLDYYTWKKGVAVIINHEYFKYFSHLPKREGTNRDKRDLQRMFEKFGFEVRPLQDKTKQEIIDELTRVARSNIYDCVFVVVLTHGEEGDWLYSADMSYQSKELWDCFRRTQCSSLIAKPKIFLIQACRGEDASVNARQARRIERDSALHRRAERTIPTEADILVAHSTYEGKVAHRNTEDGSWFIQALFNEILVNGEKDDFVSMLTGVNRRVAILEHGDSKQMPVLQSTLTRKLFLTGKDPTQETRNVLREITGTRSSVEARLDDIADILEKKGSVSKKPATRWKELGSIPDVRSSQQLPEVKKVRELSKELKTYLESKNLSREMLENGKLLLNYLKFWQFLENNERIFAYARLTQMIDSFKASSSTVRKSTDNVVKKITTKTDTRLKTVVEKKVIVPSRFPKTGS